MPLITDKDLRGHLARWVCQQHPYRSVDGVDQVGAEIDAMAKTDGWEGNDELRLHEFDSWRDVEEWLRKAIWDHPQMKRWNTPKNGGDFQVQFVSRFSHPPEQDFIDLDALVRNVSRDAFKEAERIAAE